MQYKRKADTAALGMLNGITHVVTQCGGSRVLQGRRVEYHRRMLLDLIIAGDSIDLALAPAGTMEGPG